MCKILLELKSHKRCIVLTVKRSRMQDSHLREPSGPGTINVFQHVSVLNSQNVLRNDVTLYALAQICFQSSFSFSL